MAPILQQLRERVAARHDEAKAAESAAAKRAQANAERYADLVTRLAKGERPPRGLGKPEAVEALLSEVETSTSCFEADIRQVREALDLAPSHDAEAFAVTARRAQIKLKLQLEAANLEERAKALRHCARVGDYGDELPDDRPTLSAVRLVLPFVPEGPERTAYWDARRAIDAAGSAVEVANTQGIRMGRNALSAEEAEERLVAAVAAADKAWAALLPKVQFTPKEDRQPASLPINSQFYL